ncbi:MAG TPA: hypothetical protein VJZ26_13820 [Blastocatellia bacterium]|nr:hypothetical protein [Blastocatellia bacterium]
MMNKKSVAIILFLFVAAASLSGCAKPPDQPMKEAPSSPAVPPPAPPPTQPADSQDPQKVSAIPQPTLAEARAAVARVYKDVVIVDASRAPGFVVGDFNGDGAQDIAVVVKPVRGKLAEINHELAGWLLKDARIETAPEPGIRKEPQSRPVVGERDQALLAVIHGHGPDGWRNPEAQISYLLKNAVGGGIRSQMKRSVLKANKGKEIPPLIGDVINQTIAGTPGFIFYTGSAYGWYDARKYQGEIARRMPH